MGEEQSRSTFEVEEKAVMEKRRIQALRMTGVRVLKSVVVFHIMRICLHIPWRKSVCEVIILRGFLQF